MTSRFEHAAYQFYRVGEYFSKFGASDTEPRAEFAEVVIALYNGRDPKVPTTIRGWQLFSGMESGEAARALTKATREVVAAAKSDPMGLSKFVHDQGWENYP